MQLIAGLGNPGPQYAATRHNVGFRVVELLSRRSNITLNRHLHGALWGRGRLGMGEIILVKPLTYMNRSGQAVASLLRHFALAPESLLVIYDDASLPLGRLRLRRKGSAGGHKGLASIVDLVGTQEFPRLRVGIGTPPPEQEMADYVLDPFSPMEEVELSPVLDEAVRAVELYLTRGLEAAMNWVNGPSIIE